MGGGQSRESNYIVIIYTITDEIPGFFLLLKNHMFIVAVKILFLSFTCEDIGVTMVTNICFCCYRTENISIIFFISPL